MKKRKLMLLLILFISAMTLKSQVAPITTATPSTTCGGNLVIVTVTASEIIDIGAISLYLDFNSAALTYVSSSTNQDLMANFTVSYDPANPNLISAGGNIDFLTSEPPVTLPDSPVVLYTVTFIYNPANGPMNFSWPHVQNSDCEYSDGNFEVLDDDPETGYYIVAPLVNAGTLDAPGYSIIDNPDGTSTITVTGQTGAQIVWADGNFPNPRTVNGGMDYLVHQTLNGCTSANAIIHVALRIPPSCGITGSSTILGKVPSTYTAPSGMTSYSWSVTGCGASIVGSMTGSSVSVKGPCAGGNITIHLTVGRDGYTSTCTKTVAVTASNTITVYSSLYTTGSGCHPTTVKTALPAELKVYTRNNNRNSRCNQNNYCSIWNSTNGLVSNYSVSAGVLTTYGGGPAYCYVITVPVLGNYIVIGKSNVPSTRYQGGYCTVYSGKKVGGHFSFDCDDHDDDDDFVACTNSVISFHSVIKDHNGYCSEGKTCKQYGSLLLVITPASIEFTDSVQLLPIVYESVEGDWSVEVSAEPPEGFYTIPDGSLSTQVVDSVFNAVQFMVADTGSVWTSTTVTHKLLHKGLERSVISHPVMINSRTNKPVAINIQPNPATDKVSVYLPGFEGKADLSVYNIYGQKVSGRKINIVGGASTMINVSGLAPGMYIIIAENAYGRVSSKMIKN